MSSHDIELPEPKYPGTKLNIPNAIPDLYTAEQVVMFIEADRKTLSNQLSAYIRLTESLEKRLTLLQAQHDELKKSNNPDLLASERAANAILTAELEADRQKNNALIRYMPEVIAALKATGCNESLVVDIQKSMRGERNRQESEPAYWRITKTDGVIFFECYHAAVENYKKEGWIVEPLYTAPQPQARGELVAWMHKNGLAIVLGPLNGAENSSDWTPLYTSPQTPQIPEGYALVPIEPTQEMKDAADFRSERYGHIATNKYKAMIKAAPQPTNQGE